MPWQPPLSKYGYSHRPLPVVCAGYTTRLPEVLEAARAREWAVRGQLDVFLGGERATGSLLEAIDILDAEVKALEVWITATAPRDQGGRQ